MRPKRSPGGDSALAALARRQHGVVAVAQLGELGMSQRAVSHRVASGRLHRLHRGVYAVGHRRLSREARWMAAVLACGTGALLANCCAAALWGLIRWPPAEPEVVVPAQIRRRRGIRVRVVRGLTAADRAIADAIPVTSVPRTLLALAANHPRLLDGAVAAAERRSLLDMRAVEELLARVGGRHGARTLGAALSAYLPEFNWTRSELERRFLALCGRAGLPRPQVNAWIALDGDGVEADFSWPQARLVVETDGHAHHRDRTAFERDRRRDQLLVADGWRVVRFTWRQLDREPAAVAETLRRLLGCR